MTYKSKQLFVLILAICSAFLLLGWLGRQTATAVAAPQVRPVTDNCWATIDNTTVYSSTDASAVQTAVNTAAANNLVKIAGTCAGVQVQGSVTQTVYINKSLSLQGGYTHTNWLATPDPDTFPTVLDAEGNGRVIYIPNNNYQVTLDNLNITNGYVDGDGGGIWTRDMLTVTNSIIQDSFASDDGGGVYFGTGSMGYFDNSIIAHNTIPTTTGLYFGGGIYSGPNPITIKNSSIYSNTARLGAGIASLRAHMTIENSSIHDNIAFGQAGGINNQEGTMTLLNSTISQNSSPLGSGIVNVASNNAFTATVILSQTSVVSNTGQTGIRNADISPLNMVGLALETDSDVGLTTPTENFREQANTLAQIILSNSIIAHHDTFDCLSTGTSNQIDVTHGYNLDTDGSCVTDGVDNNITADPLLLPLADNSGGTWTHALQADSPALDRIALGINGCGTTITTDQRGVTRPSNDACDIGAFEYLNLPPIAMDDTYTTTEDMALTVTAPGVLTNDSNPNGDILTATLSSSPTNGVVQLSHNGALIYTPNLEFNGVDTFIYQIQDGIDPALGYWSFNDGLNPTSDDSGHGHDGVLNGDTTFTTTVPMTLGTGLAIELDGVGDNITVNNIHFANRSFSVAFWAKRDQIGSTNIIVSQGANSTNQGLRIGFRNDDAFTCGFRNNDLNTSTTYTDTEWHHWACIYDAVNNQRRIYRDGQLVVADAPTNDYEGSGTFIIGSRYGNIQYMSGLVDDVRIYPHELSASGVQAAMLGSVPNGLVDSAIVTVTVTAVEDPPIAVDDVYTTTEDSTLTVIAPGVLANDTDPEGGVVTATLSSDPANGIVQLNGDGAFVYTPNLNFNGQDTFTYQIQDRPSALGYWPFDDGLNPTADESGNGNDGVLNGDTTFSTTVPLTLGAGLAIELDGAGDNITISNSIDLANRSFSVAFWAKRDQIDTADIIVSQGTNIDYQGVQIGFRPNNIFTCAFWGDPLDSPSPYTDLDWHHWACTYDAATNQRTLYRDGQVITSNVALNDYTGSGTFFIGSRFDNAEYMAGLVDDVRVYPYELSGGDVQMAMLGGALNGLTDTATVTVTVTAVNDPPVAMDNVYTTTEDVALTVIAPGVLANDSDLDGDVLTATLSSEPANGMVQLSGDGALVYTPNLDFNGLDTFIYKIQDGPDLTLGYWPFDDGLNPTTDESGNGHDGVLNGDTTFTTTVPATLGTGLAIELDGAGDNITVSNSIDLANRFFSVAFWAKRDQIDTADIIVSQGTNIDYQGVQIGFRPNNIFTCAFWGDPLDSSSAYTDLNWHHWACTYDATTNQRILYRDGQVVASDTAANDYEGSGTLFIGSRFDNTQFLDGLVDDVRIYAYELGASDIQLAMLGNTPHGLVDTATVTVTVTAVNDIPIALADTFTTTEDITLTVTAPGVLANDTDADGNPLTAILDSDVSDGNLTLNSDGSFTYLANTNYCGTDNFTYLADDGLGGQSVTTTVTLNVVCISKPPLAINDGYTATEDITLSIVAPGVLTNDSDGDGDELTAVLDTTVTSGTLTLNSDGSFTYIPDADFCGTDNFTYHAHDGQADSNMAAVTINVTCLNDAPTAVDDMFSVLEDSSHNAFNVLVNDGDVDGDALSITAVTSATHGTAAISGTHILYTPEANFVGMDVFTYTISDGVLADTAVVTISVDNENDAPTAVDDAYTVDEGSSDNLLDVLSNDSDIDVGDSLSVTAVTSPTNGTAIISGTIILYTPYPDFIGTDSFTYTITDGTVSDVATVTVIVEPASAGFILYLPFVTKP